MDRDGVINKKLPGDYVKNWSQFRFLAGVPDAINILASHFGKIIIVTNQQGIGKGLMQESDLHQIHEKMLGELGDAGKKITAIYYCPALAADNDPCRKPETGMGLQAKADYPDIDFSRSVMVGDAPSDMQFGSNLGMTTVGIYDPDLRSVANYFYDSLLDFASGINR